MKCIKWPNQNYEGNRIDDNHKKQARKLQATLVRNYDRLADGGEVWSYSATSVAKKFQQWQEKRKSEQKTLKKIPFSHQKKTFSLAECS